MKNEITRQKIKELLSSDVVIDQIMLNLNYMVNDDLMTGNTLVLEAKYHTYNDMQLQVRVCNRKHQFFANYGNKSPHFDIDKNLDMVKVDRQTKYEDYDKLI